MIGRLAIAFGVIGVLIAASFIRRGPSVSTPSTPLRWTSGAIDAGELEVQFTVGGVDFMRARDTDEPMLSFAVLRRGEQRLVIDDFNWFHTVESREGRLWAVAENTTEGGGPSLELVVSSDEGKSFEWRASVPKPNYQAMFEAFTVSGDELTLVMSIDDEIPLDDAWVWPWWRLEAASASRPTVGPGRFALRSKNGGRSWRLER